MRKLRASAPLRVDLAGGTIDLWPLYLLHDGACTANVALSLRAQADFTPGGKAWRLVSRDRDAARRVPVTHVARAAREAGDGDPFALVLRVLDHLNWRDGGTIGTRVEGPPGGGLAGSSALMVALLGLIHRGAGHRLVRARGAALARDLEAQVLGLPTGVQDYYPALYGGALRLDYGPGGARHRRLDVDLDALEARCVLAYSGRPHESAPSNWGIYRRRLEGDRIAVESFEAIAAAGAAAADALERGSWARLGDAMTADWAARKKLDPGLAPPQLRALEKAGLAAGARAAKCCGAASGGTMLFLLRRPTDRARVERGLENAGARILAFRAARRGLVVR